MPPPADRISDAPFSSEEAAHIRHLLNHPGTPLGCPRCGTPLTSDTPVAGAEGSNAVWLLRCAECRRFAIFDDLGERAAPRGRHTL